MDAFSNFSNFQMPSYLDDAKGLALNGLAKNKKLLMVGFSLFALYIAATQVDTYATVNGHSDANWARFMKQIKEVVVSVYTWAPFVIAGVGVGAATAQSGTIAPSIYTLFAVIVFFGALAEFGANRLGDLDGVKTNAQAASFFAAVQSTSRLIWTQSLYGGAMGAIFGMVLASKA
jgi:hypothetical protein